MFDIYFWLWRHLRKARNFLFIIQQLSLYQHFFHVAVPEKSKRCGQRIPCGNNISVSVCTPMCSTIFFFTDLRCIESIAQGRCGILKSAMEYGTVCGSAGHWMPRQQYHHGRVTSPGGLLCYPLIHFLSQ